MVEIFEPMKQSGYLRDSLMETEKIEYEGTYHRPATLIVEFIWHKEQPLITGARMYNEAGRYIGWWPSHNVPRIFRADWASRIAMHELQVRKVFANPKSGEEALEHL